MRNFFFSGKARDARIQTTKVSIITYKEKVGLNPICSSHEWNKSLKPTKTSKKDMPVFR